MVLVRKKKRFQAPVETVAIPQGGVSKFLDECRSFSSYSRLGVYLVGRYRSLFGTEPPNAMLCLIKSKIAYRLDYLEKKAKKQEISEKFMNNYEASQKLDLNGFDEDSKFFMELDVKRENKEGGENVMAKVKKKVSKESKAEKVAPAKDEAKAPEGLRNKSSVRATLAPIFAANAKAKLTDEQILALVKKAHPDKKNYTVGTISSHRKGYNDRLPKGSTPVVKVEAAKK